MDSAIECFIQKNSQKIFRSRVKENEYTPLTGNVVIVSDRLTYLAKELFSYMKESTNANVIKLLCKKEDMETCCKDIDYLIIVGYLEQEESYAIIDMIRSENINVKTIQWAMLDDYIESLSIKYNIFFQFDRFRPPREFIDYLEEIKKQRDYDKLL